MPSPDQRITALAREQLGIPTLQPRWSDALDFHDVAAFHAGIQAGCETAAASAGQAEPAAPLLVPTGTPLAAGRMYLRLYHGRMDPDQEMDAWGFAGPTFGPLSCYVHTYGSTFRMHGDHAAAEIWLETHDDMIVWDGCFYGDLEMFIAGTNDRAWPHDR